jgi:NAD(P)-dependent dehydrogenase (short-subunit alcohol dehydrogenase family)
MASRAVLITGSSTGIGRVCAARLAGAGWRVYAGVRKDEDGQRLTDEIGAGVLPVMLDVTTRSHVDEVLARIEREVGSLDGLVNNAGIGVGGPIEVLTDEEWQHQFDVNFFSVVALTREAMPLVDRAKGRFVHIGSIGGRISSPGLAPYSASKHALEAFNWSLRAELAHTGMRSSLVEPGEISTDIWEKGEATMKDLDARITGPTRERYQFLLDGSRGFLEEGRTKGIDADKVAVAVEKALTARRPKARYLVGPDAKFLGHVLSKLPDRAREAVLALNDRRFQKAGAKLRA